MKESRSMIKESLNVIGFESRRADSRRKARREGGLFGEMNDSLVEVFPSIGRVGAIETRC
jgi:hypothetical protein